MAEAYSRFGDPAVERGQEDTPAVSRFGDPVLNAPVQDVPYNPAVKGSSIFSINAVGEANHTPQIESPVQDQVIDPIGGDQSYEPPPFFSLTETDPKRLSAFQSAVSAGVQGAYNVPAGILKSIAIADTRIPLDPGPTRYMGNGMDR